MEFDTDIHIIDPYFFSQASLYWLNISTWNESSIITT
jgi:hypothetical protein